MGGKVSISPRGEELVIFRGDRAIMKEIFQASKERIAQMNKAGVAQGRTGIAEPERQHLPVLTNMEEYKDWVKKATSYVMDKRLARKNENDQIVGREIEIENIFQPVITRNGKTKKCRHVMILGAAGMGKTTILRRIALYCGEEMLKGKLVIMLDFRTLPLKEKMCPSEVLQANIFSDRDSERMKLRYQWILDNRDKIVFIIDSLDTLPFDLDNKRPRIGYHTPATVDVILHNLLARELFPKSCIVSSSREYKVRNLHPSVQPDRCILLDGLKEDSVKDLIDGFLGEEKGTKVKEHINTKCPDIWPLLSIPVVMIFSVIGFVQDGFKPATLSGILIKFFTCLIRSTHAHVKDILSVLKKLMPLALEGIRKGFVLFTPEDLKRFGLEPEEVTDLGILIPQSHGTFFSTKLMQNDRFFLYFNHQTEQEALAALQILSLCLVEFNTFVECEIWEIQFTVVRRLICGSLMNDEVLDAAQEITEISDVDQKKNILIRSLGVALKKYQQENEGAKLLELFIDLSECREGATELIRSSVKKIDFASTSLSPSDVQAVAYVMKQCEYLKEVNLDNSNLNGKKVKILATTITRSNFKLKSLNVDWNNNIGSGGMFHLGRFVKNSTLEELSAQYCDLKSEHLENFSKGAANAELKILDVSQNENIGSGGMFHLGRFVKNSTLEELSAWGCGLESEHLQKFAEGAQNATLKKLDVDDNENIGSGGMFHLGRFVKNSTLEELSVTECGLKSEHLEKFAEGAQNATFRKLGVSGNKDIGPEGMRLLGKLVKHNEVKEVLAINCNPNEENVQKFAEGLGEAKFDSLDLSYVELSYDAELQQFTKVVKPVYVPSLLNLLPRVNKEIKLQGWKINEIQQRELQDKLNRICSPTLSITLGEKENPIVLKTRDSETVAENQVELPTSEETPVGSSTDGSSTHGPSTGDEEMGTGQLEDDPDLEVKITSKENDDKSESITTTEESKDSAEGKTTEISDETSTSGTGTLQGTLFALTQSDDETQLESTTSGETAADRKAAETETSDETPTSGISILISPGTSPALEKSEDGTKSESTAAVEADAGYRAVETGATAGHTSDNKLRQLEFHYIPRSTDKEIGPEGDNVSVDESSLTIPPKSLVDTQNLSMSMLMDFHNISLPADRIPVSPYLDVKFCGKLRIPARARVPTWFRPSDDLEHGIKIYKRYRDEENKFAWRELQNEVKIHDGIIEFEIDHFCGFIAMIKDLWHWVNGEIRLSHGLLHRDENFLSVICYQSPESLFQQMIAHLEKKGHKEIYRDRFVMKCTQEVPIKMECFDPHLHEFEPQQHLLTPSHIRTNKQKQFPFLLQQLKEPMDAVKIKYIVNDFIAPFKVKLLDTKDAKKRGRRNTESNTEPNEEDGNGNQATCISGAGVVNISHSTIQVQAKSK